MSSEEKAKELIEKFKKYSDGFVAHYGYNSTVREYSYSVEENTRNAKACALICVEEILQEWRDFGANDKSPVIHQWQQVKEHINQTK